MCERNRDLTNTRSRGADPRPPYRYEQQNMRLSTVLLSVNDNKDYYDFVPYLVKYWNRIGVQVVVVFVGHAIPQSLQPYASHLRLWNRTPHLNSVYVAQHIRLYYPALLDVQDDELVMITDMDTLPLSRAYFKDGLEDCAKRDFLHWGKVPVVEFKDRQVYIQSNAAHPDTWRHVNGVSSEEDIARLLNARVNPGFSGKPDSQGWCDDQTILYDMVHGYPHFRQLQRLEVRLAAPTLAEDFQVHCLSAVVFDKHATSLQENMHAYTTAEFHRSVSENVDRLKILEDAVKQYDAKFAVATKQAPLMDISEWTRHVEGLQADAKRVSRLTQALYGSEAGLYVDVTENVRRVQEAHTSSVLVVNNDTMGHDPHPGVRKRLYLQWMVDEDSLKGSSKTVHVEAQESTALTVEGVPVDRTLEGKTTGVPVDIGATNDELLSQSHDNDLFRRVVPLPSTASNNISFERILERCGVSIGYEENYSAACPDKTCFYGCRAGADILYDRHHITKYTRESPLLLQDLDVFVFGNCFKQVMDDGKIKFERCRVYVHASDLNVDVDACLLQCMKTHTDTLFHIQDLRSCSNDDVVDSQVRRVLPTADSQVHRCGAIRTCRDRPAAKTVMRDKVKEEKNMESLFTRIYEQHLWGTNEGQTWGTSGPGSDVHSQTEYIKFLRQFIVEKAVTSVVDLGCGDFVAGSLIYDGLNVQYTGYDVYGALIDHHARRYKDAASYTFHHLDVSHHPDRIVSADLCIMKDVLQHWSTKNIYAFLDDILRRRLFRYILICNCCVLLDPSTQVPQIVRATATDSADIEDGWWRILTASQYPLKKYAPDVVFRYGTKEVSIIHAG